MAGCKRIGVRMQRTGGGQPLTGLATAWYLVKQGVSVLACEKGRVAGEQSSRCSERKPWERGHPARKSSLPILDS